MNLEFKTKLFHFLIRYRQRRRGSHKVWEINRTCILPGTMLHLYKETKVGVDLKGELKIKLLAEIGQDYGGVRQEYFHLVFKQIFDSHHGFFPKSGSEYFWFSKSDFSIIICRYIGLLLGLAFNNCVLVDLPLPGIFFKKLLGKKVKFDDLEEFDSALYKTLQHLLKEEDEEIVKSYDLTFEIEYEIEKEIFKSHELIPNGATIYVNQQNKKEFVDKYSDFLLNKSIEIEWNAFRSSFYEIVNFEEFATFKLNEIERVLCGQKHLDLEELKSTARYEGFTAQSPTILYFWEVLKEFDQEQQRTFLVFLTGNDRTPIGGLAKLNIIIANDGTNYNLLPTASTCFNTLKLPDYLSKENLKIKLLKSLEYFLGFGFC